ncbi:hypothetical protein [Rhodanobacter sp. C06]|uniref:hypothetical protein n=1 Tax=Rhodanobacter sp. C06 TaxID=1945854 RepID=UPI0011158190|nr:hypothetical protein [Rhodanobacter sp. C06]
MIDEHEKPRCERTPQEYVGQILGSICNSLIELGFFRSEDEYMKVMFNHAVYGHVNHGMGGTEVYKALTSSGRFEQIQAILRDKGMIPEERLIRSFPDNRMFWGLVATTYCVEAMAAYNAGQVTEAWTYVVDARFAADALISQRTDILMVKQDRTGSAKKRVAAKLAKDPVQAAKAMAYKLWQERHAGKHPKLRTNEQFAMECMHRWPVLTSAKVICGWCTEWNKEAKKSQPAS